MGESFELVSETGLLEILYSHYGISDVTALLEATDRDWRFVFPKDIAEEVEGYNVIPRSPFVLLMNDPNWRPLDQIQPYLEAFVKAKAKQQQRRNS